MQVTRPNHNAVDPIPTRCLLHRWSPLSMISTFFLSHSLIWQTGYGGTCSSPPPPSKALYPPLNTNVLKISYIIIIVIIMLWIFCSFLYDFICPLKLKAVMKWETRTKIDGFDGNMLVVCNYMETWKNFNLVKLYTTP